MVITLNLRPLFTDRDSLFKDKLFAENLFKFDNIRQKWISEVQNNRRLLEEKRKRKNK